MMEIMMMGYGDKEWRWENKFKTQNSQNPQPPVLLPPSAFLAHEFMHI